MLATFILIFICGLDRTQAFSSLDSEGLFTSSQDLIDLLSTEAELIKSLKSYIHLEQSRLEQLKE